MNYVMDHYSDPTNSFLSVNTKSTAAEGERAMSSAKINQLLLRKLNCNKCIRMRSCVGYNTDFYLFCFQMVNKKKKRMNVWAAAVRFSQKQETTKMSHRGRRDREMVGINSIIHSGCGEGLHHPGQDPPLSEWQMWIHAHHKKETYIVCLLVHIRV